MAKRKCALTYKGVRYTDDRELLKVLNEEFGALETDGDGVKFDEFPVRGKNKFILTLNSTNYKNGMAAYLSKANKPTPEFSTDNPVTFTPKEMKSMGKKKKSKVKESENTKFVRKILSKFTRKYSEGLETPKNLRLGLTERTEVVNAIASTFSSQFLALNQDNLSKDMAEVVYKNTWKSTIETMQEVIGALEQYLKDHEGSDSGEFVKALQYKTLLEQLVEPGNKAFSNLMKTGVGLASTRAGYRVKFARNVDIGVTNDIEEDLDLDEEVKVTKGEQYGALSSLARNPLGSSTSRMKVKVGHLNKYELNEDGEVVMATDILGKPIFIEGKTNDSAYTLIQDLLTETYGNSFGEKLNMLKSMATRIKADPTRHVRLYFVLDLVAQLENRAPFNNYTKAEKKKFNIIFGRDNFHSRGLSKNGKKGETQRMFLEDHNYSNVFRSTIVKLQVAIRNLKVSEGRNKLFKKLVNPGTAKFKVEKEGNTTKYFSSLNEGLKGGFQDIQDNGGISAKVEAIGKITNAIDLFTSMSADIPKTYELQFGHKLYDGTGKDKVLTEDAEYYINELRTVAIALSEDVAKELENIMVFLGSEVPADFNRSLSKALYSNEMMDKISFDGSNVVGQELASKTVSKFIAEVNTLATTDRGKNLTRRSKNFINFFTKLAGGVVSSVLRIKSKLLSVYNPKVPMLTAVKNLSNPDFILKMKKDIYGSNSVILKVREQFKERKDWLGNLFSDAYRSNIASMWLSEVSKNDNPKNNSIFTFGSYLVKAGFGNSTETKQMPGEPYETIEIDMGGHTHILEVRAGDTASPTLSDSGARFNMTGLDFNAYDIVITEDPETGVKMAESVLKDEYVKFFADAVLLSDINRMKKASDLESVEVDGYQPNMVYSIPSLNAVTTDQDIRELIKAIELNKGENLESLYGTQANDSKKNDTHHVAMAELRGLAEEHVRNTLDQGKKAYKEHLINTRVLERTSTGDLVLAESLSDIAEFKNLGKSIISEDKVATESLETRKENVWQNSVILFRFLEDVNYGGDVVSKEEILDEIEDSLENFVTNPEALKDWAEEEMDNYKTAEEFLDAVLVEAGVKFSKANKKKVGTILAKGPVDKAGDTTRMRLVDSYLQGYFAKGEFTGNKAKFLVNEVKEYAAISKIFSAAENKNGVNETTLDHVVGNKVFMSAFNTHNMYQLFMGDPAGYAKRDRKVNRKGTDVTQEGYDHMADIRLTKENMSKRDGRMNSPGEHAEGSGTTIYIAYDEQERPSYEYTVDNGFSIEVEEGMSKLEIDDGATYASPMATLQHYYNEGEIEDYQVEDVLKFYEGEMTFEELVEIYNIEFVTRINPGTMKPRAIGRLESQIGDSGLTANLPYFIKTGETTLTRTLIGRDPNNPLVKVRGMMDQIEARNRNKKGKLLPVNQWVTARAGSGSAMKLHRPESVINLKTLTGSPDSKGVTRYDIKDNNLLTIPLDTYARQVRTDVHEAGQNRSGQVDDLNLNSVPADLMITINGVEDTVFNHWDKSVADQYEYGFEILRAMLKSGNTRGAVRALLENDLVDLKEFEDKEPVSSDKVIAQLVRESLISNHNGDVSAVNKAMLNLLRLDKNGNFVYDLSKSMFFLDFMDSLRTTIEKRTVKYKRAGYNIPLMPDFGIDTRKNGTADGSQIYMLDTYEPTPEGHLRPQTEKNPAEIILPWINKVYTADGSNMDLPMPLKTIVGEDGETRKVIDTDKLLDETLYQLTHRVPMQDYSMMSSSKVVGFHIKQNRNSAITPAEFTKLMGSDFDIDKLFGFLYNLIEDTNEKGETIYRKINKADAEANPKLKKPFLDNTQLDIQLEILRNSDIVNDEIVKSLAEEKAFTGVTDPIKDYRKAEQAAVDQSYLMPSYQDTKFNNEATAGEAVGVFALAARISAVLQGKGLKLHTRDETGMLVPTKSKRLGSGRNSIQIETLASGRVGLFQESEGLEKAFDRAKDNFSALISVAVDNAKLQLAHVLQFGNKTYSIYQGLVMSGFKASTVATIVDNVMFSGKKPMSETRKDLIDLYNSRRGKNEVKLVERDPGKNSKVVSAGDFTLLTQGMDETELQERILGMNRRLYEEEPTQLDIINALALYDFASDVAAKYDHTVNPIKWGFNMDSKGVKRDLGDIVNIMGTIQEGGPNASVWDTVKEIPSLKYAAETVRYMYQMTQETFIKDEVTINVIKLLKQASIEIPNSFELSSTLVAFDHKHMKPYTKSLVQRLDALASHPNPKVRDYYRNNLFLSNLNVTSGVFPDITFNKSEKLNPNDIIYALEDIARMGELGGIDMAALHHDLIYFGLTNTSWTYGNNYNAFIDPSYYLPPSEVVSAEDQELSIALGVSYRNKHLVRRVSKKKESPYPIWVETETDELHYNYVDKTGKLREGVYDKDHHKELFGYNQEQQVESVLTVDDINEQGIEELNITASLDRVFSSPSDQSLKALLKKFLPSDTIMTRSGEDSSYDAATSDTPTQININGTLKSPTQVKGAILHESIHAITDPLAKAWEDNVLESTFKSKVPGTSLQENKIIGQELQRTMDNMYNGMLKVSANMAKTTIGTFEKLMSYEKDQPGTTPWLTAAAFLDMYILTDFNGGHEFSDLLTVDDITRVMPWIESPAEMLAQYQTDPDIGEMEARILALTGVIKAIKEDKFKTENRVGNPLSKRQSLVYTTPTGHEVVGSIIDENSFNSFKDMIIEMDKMYTRKTSTFEVQLSKIREETSKAYSRTKSTMYGLSSIGEFMSSVYSLGVGYKRTKGYSSFISSYASASNTIPPSLTSSEHILSELFEEIKEITDSVLGVRRSNYLWDDVLYFATLSNYSTLVTPIARQEAGDVSWGETPVAREIKLKC